jgi:hypothetical protein
MSEYPSPFGTLSDGSTLVGDSRGGPTPPPRKPWLPVLVIALVALVALVMVAGAAFLLLSGDDEGSSDEPASTQSTPKGTEDHADERDVQPAPTPEAPAEPSSPEQPSLLSVKGTTRAFQALIRASKGREAMTLRVDPDRVTAIVKGKVLTYSKGGELQDLPGPPATIGTFDLTDVDPAAPSRIEKALREKGKTLDYMAYVSNAAFVEDTWVVAANDGTAYYRADPDGRNLRKNG